MWIYTEAGFYSIVEDRETPGLLLVRARVKGDIERLWPKAKVEHTPESDYAFRARIPRSTVSKVLAQETKDIDYNNFKDRVYHQDKERAYWYGRVWSIMTCMQAVIHQIKTDK